MGVKVVMAAFVIGNTQTKNLQNIDKYSTYVELRTIDPAGVVSDKLLLAVAVGKDNDKANALLAKRYHYGLDIKKMKIMLVNIMREVLLETNTSTNNQFNGGRYDTHKDDYIICEVLNKNGIINWEK